MTTYSYQVNGRMSSTSSVDNSVPLKTMTSRGEGGRNVCFDRRREEKWRRRRRRKRRECEITFLKTMTSRGEGER